MMSVIDKNKVSARYYYKTDNFVIRPFTIDDHTSFKKHLQHADVYQNTYRFPKIIDDNFVTNYLTTAIEEARQPNPKSLHLAIDVGGEVVGDVSFLKIDTHGAEMAYWLSPSHWGKGIMPRAARWLCDYGFEHFDIVRIYACVFTYNTNSQRVLTKIGFEQEGCMRKSYKKDGIYLDANLYSLIQDV